MVTAEDTLSQTVSAFQAFSDAMGCAFQAFSDTMSEYSDFLAEFDSHLMLSWNRQLLRRLIRKSIMSPCEKSKKDIEDVSLKLLSMFTALKERGPPKMITLKHSGNFNKTERFLSGAKRLRIRSILENYGRLGVSALSAATPVDTGKTANSWCFQLTVVNNNYTISWTNSNVVNGVPIAIILQYGHGTRNGGFVSGRDYINPALAPIFDGFVEAIWKEVTSL